MRKPFAIIYEDDEIIVLDKAARVLTLPDRFDPIKPNLRALLLKMYGDIYVVHRLDVETSGVMVFAKNEKSHAHLSEQFQNRSVNKVYQALTQYPHEDEGIVEIGIEEHRTKKGKYIASLEGKESKTSYKVIKKIHHFALVELTIHTGRTHQIRVHMKHIGAPLLTDKKYGLYEAFYLSQIKKLKFNRDKVERPLLSRSSLHSARLSFTHPTTGAKSTYEAPLHKDMKAVIFQLEKQYDR